MGTELGPLAAGALLAKRGFRVLVVGQNAPTDRYDCYGYSFSRRPFRLTAADSPAIRRFIQELGVGPVFGHMLHTPSPLYQVILPRARIDVCRDPSATEKEVSRELPDADVDVAALFDGLGRISGELDKLFGADVVLPPETFFEKREFARAEVQNPFRASPQAARFLSELEGSELLEFLEAPVRFETSGVEPLPPLVRFRLMAGWLFDCHKVEGGRDGLARLFADLVVSQGGDVNPRQKIVEIVVQKGRVAGVRMGGREDLTGCQTVLTDLSPRELSPLVPPSAWTKRFRALVEQSPPSVLGYAVNLGVDREVIPSGLAQTAFASLGKGLGADLLRLELVPQSDPKRAAIHAACVVPPGEERSIESGALRDAVLDRIRELVPFLDHHLKVIHSPFDGFGPLDLTGRAEGSAPEVPHEEEIQRWLLRRPLAEGVLGVGNQPHRTGIKGLLLSGSQVVSGLGPEGELIAAWAAARITGRMDTRRERMVRSMRSKVEI